MTIKHKEGESFNEEDISNLLCWLLQHQEDVLESARQLHELSTKLDTKYEGAFDSAKGYLDISLTTLEKAVEDLAEVKFTLFAGKAKDFQWEPQK